jgi:hypothetical protein
MFLWLVASCFGLTLCERPKEETVFCGEMRAIKRDQCCETLKILGRTLLVQFGSHRVRPERNQKKTYSRPNKRRPTCEVVGPNEEARYSYYYLLIAT